MSEERLTAIEALLGKVVTHGDTLAGGQEGLVTRMDDLAAGQKRLETDVKNVDHQMRVLHEEVIANIKALPEFSGPTQSEMTQAVHTLSESIGRRLDPLEAVVTRHSSEIEQLKKARG